MATTLPPLGSVVELGPSPAAGAGEAPPAAPATAPASPALAELPAIGQEVALPQPAPEAAARAAAPDPDERLRQLFAFGLEIPPSEAAGVNYLARELDLPPRLVAMQYPLFKKAAEAARFDPARFRRENPGLVELLLENPRSGIHPLQAQQISPVTRALRSYSAYADEHPLLTGGMALPGMSTGEILDLEDELLGRAPSVESRSIRVDPLRQVPTRESPLKGRHGPESTAAILADEGRRGLLAVELGDVGFSLLVAHQLGEDQELLRRRQLEIEQELGVQVDYGQNVLEQLGIDASKAVTSQWAPVREGGKGYAVGATIGGVATLAASRNPWEAIRAGHLVGLILGKVGFSYGSFKQESGSLFAQLLDEKLDDGTPLDRDVAAGAAFAYGVAAAAVEVVSFGQLAKSLGPLREAILRGEGRAAIRAWLADRSKREILKDLGKQWAKAAASEPLEEAAQTTLQYAITWSGKSLAAGAPQTFDREAFTLELGESIWLGAVGGGTMAAPGTVASGTLRLEYFNRSQRNGRVVAELAKVAGTEAALGAPDAIAALVTREARRAGAGEITHAYLDAEAAETFFQSQGTDAGSALTELLGEDMRGKVAAAKAGENLGRIEIPLGTYLEKLGPTGVAEALAGDTAVRPFDATLREQAKLQQDLLGEADDVVQLWQKEGKVPDPEPGEIEWSKDLAAKAVASGAAKKADAKRFELTARAFVRTMVKRYGEPARKLLQRYAVEVQPAEKMPPIAEGQAAVPQAGAADAAPADETKLQQQTPAVTETAAFKEWSGGAPVIEDASAQRASAEVFSTGKPVVVKVAHGTPVGEFDSFAPEKRGEATRAASAKMGFFFAGHLDTARAYTGTYQEVPMLGWARLNRRQKRDVAEALFPDLDPEIDGTAALIEELQALAETEEGLEEIAATAERITGQAFDRTALQPHVFQVYVRLKNPLVYDFKSASWRDQSYASIVAQAQAEGHDGVILRNTRDGGPVDNIFVAFEPTQIKSATGNSGAFDAANPSIFNASQGEKDQGWTRFYRVARKGLNQLFQVATTPDQDATTLLHEFAHIGLEIFGDLAGLEDAPAAAKAEYARILEWLGVAKREELTREHHEKFAEAFEAYLFEGKTPSVRLASVFARMRAWFLRVGRQLREEGVPLNDEIRGLFDRMLATDQEIEAIREQAAAGDAADVFPSPEAAGLTPDQYEEYLAAKERSLEDARIRVQQRLLAEQQVANEGALKQARRDARARAGKEYDDLPAVRALRLLRRGDAGGDPGLLALQAEAREREAAEPQAIEVPKEIAERLAELEREEAELRASGGTRRVLAVVQAEFQVPGTADGRGAPTNLPPLFRIRVAPYRGGRLEPDQQLRVVWIPAWLRDAEYFTEREAWEWVWAAGGRMLPQAEQRYLLDLVQAKDVARAWAVGRILQARNRTEYQEKIATRIREWLATAPAARRWDSPLSPQTWQTLAGGRAATRFRRWEIATARQVKDNLAGMGEAIEPEEGDVVSQALGEESDPREARYEAIAAERAELERQVAAARLEQQRGLVRLDLEAVVDVVGAEVAEQALRGLTRPDGGVHPDRLAELLGVRTGEDLVRQVAGLEERGSWVDRRAEDLVRREHPTLLEDAERLRAAVQEAAHAGGDLEYYLRQWSIFRSKAGDRGRPPLEAVKRAAEGIVRGKRAGALNLRAVLDAELGAARRAVEAAQRGNWRQAAVLMQQQLLNHYIYQAMLEARADRDDLERMAKTMTPEKYRGQIGRVSPAIRDAIDQILEAVGLRERVPRDRPPLPLADAIAAMESFGATVMLDRELLERLLQQPLRHTDLLVSDMRKVRDALRNLRAAALSQEEVLDGERKMKLEDAVGELQAEAFESTPELPPATEEVQKSLVQKLSSFGATVHGEVLRPLTMLRWLGGGDTRSAWYRLIFRPLQIAKQKETDLLAGPFKAVLEAFEGMPRQVRRRLTTKIDGEALFPTHRTDLRPPARRFQLLMLALNAGNESNLDRLLDGRGITMGQLERALGTLTRAELEWVQQVWDACESLWPLSRELEERDAGVAPPKIEARPMTVMSADGHQVDLRGGYFPAVYVRAVSTAGEKQALQTVKDVLSPGFVRPGTPHSHLKGRVEGFTDALATDPAIIMRHLRQVAHDLAFRPALKSTATILMDPRIQETLKRRLGPERSPQFLQWLKDIGSQRAAENAAAAGGVLKVARGLRSNLAVGILGYAADVALGDVTNLGVAVLATPLKARFWAQGLGEFLRHPREAIRWTGAKFGELRFRRERLGEEFRQHIEGMVSRSPLKRGPLARFKRHAFVFMEASDLVTSTPIAMGAYAQALAEGRTEDEAVAFAEDVVQRVFPSHSAVDSSFMLRRKDALELLSLFQGYASVLANLYLDKAHEIRKTKEPTGKARKTVEFVLFSLALGTVASVAAEFIMGRGPEDEDKDDRLSKDEWASWYGERLLLGFAYVVPVFGWTGEATWSLVTGKRPSARTAPIYSGLEGTARAAQRALAAAENEDFTEAEAIEVLKNLGILAGVPAVRPARALQFGLDLWQGEVEETAPLDVVGGFIYPPQRGGP